MRAGQFLQRDVGYREKLLALRARCKGSRLKTYQNLYCAAWQSGEVLEDPEAVYERIKSKHLLFSESREERMWHSSRAV